MKEYTEQNKNFRHKFRKRNTLFEGLTKLCESVSSGHTKQLKISKGSRIKKKKER